MALSALTNDNFAESIKSGVCVVDFWAPWCGPCRMIEPSIKELAEEITEASFFKLNVDEAQQIALQYGVMSIPTIIVFKDGEVKDTVVGVMPKGQLKDRIKSFL